MKREFTDLLRRPKDLGLTLRNTILSGALAALGLSSGSSGVAGELSNPSNEALWLPHAVVNRSKKTAKLMLHLPSRAMVIAGHVSHSSHSSHVSHYSGSTAPTPQPQTPASPAPPRTETLPPASVSETATFLDATVESIDRKTKSFVVKSITAKKSFVLQYRDDTTCELQGGVSSRLDEFQEAYADSLPFAVGDRLRISWKLSGSKKKTIAVSIAPLAE